MPLPFASGLGSLLCADGERGEGATSAAGGLPRTFIHSRIRLWNNNTSPARDATSKSADEDNHDEPPLRRIARRARNSTANIAQSVNMNNALGIFAAARASPSTSHGDAGVGSCGRSVCEGKTSSGAPFLFMRGGNGLGNGDAAAGKGAATSTGVDVPYAEPTAPTELVVLVHGLQGAVADFTYFIDQLRTSNPGKEGRMKVYASPVNTDHTHDGIVAGAIRLAEDIQRVAALCSDTLKRISLVGFSLGGMYVRYAAGLLYDPAGGTVAKLKPEKIVLVASPNLGVRNFGVYRFLPQGILSKAHVLFGDTARELVLDDGDEKLLLEMTTDENSRDIKFLSALRAFRWRCLYANVRNDFMVNYGTAALDHTIQTIGGSDVQEVISPPEAHQVVDKDYDEKGCKVCFTLEYPPKEKGAGEESKKQPVSDAEGSSEEEHMAKRLRAIGWTVVAIDFPMAMPIAHNRIVAMSRTPIHTWMNAAGRRVVHHLVDSLTDHFEETQPQFTPVLSQAPRKTLSLRPFTSE